ncbi:MAG: hypothetical protein LUD76_12480 [Alistipes sp.]|nr:hypothetical protein [Alistipes sp.]
MFSIPSQRTATRPWNPFRLFMAAVTLLFCMSGCNTDPEIDTGTDEDRINMEVSLDVPLTGTPASRAMSESDESTVQVVDVLVFRVDSGIETFAYRAHETTVPTFTGSNTMKFTVSLKRSEAGESYRLVLLANLREEVDEAMQYVAVGNTKGDVLARIQFTHNEAWPVSGDGMRYIPMWGETSGSAVIERYTTLTAFGGTIYMLRAMARVDVVLNLPSGDDKPRFDINRIKVYNALRTHAAVPDASSGFNLTDQKVTSPTVVSTQMIDPPLEYNVAGTRIEREIYIGEAENSTAAPEDNVCLLIEGYYTAPGQPLNTNSPTWYRVDFRPNDDLQARYDILRNHRYHININHVGGAGDDDEEEAFRRGPYDMESEIIVWSDDKLTDVVWLGPYYLAVSRNSIDVPGNAHSESFFVKTNYPDGWSAKVTEGNTWLGGLSPASSPNIDVSEELEFTVTENNEPDMRTGRILISCGSALSLDVAVNQYTNDESELALIILEVTDLIGTVGTRELEEIVWPGGLHWVENLNPKGFHIDWLPSWADCNMIKDPAGTYDVERVTWMREAGTLPSTLSFFDEMVIPPTDYGYTFYLTPRRFVNSEIEIDPFLEKSTNYYFTVIDHGELVSKTIKLRQIHYNLIADVEDGYLLDGSQYSFKVRANRDWTVTDVTGDTDLVTIHTMSGTADKTVGTDFNFTVIKSEDKSGAVTVTFTYTGEVGNNMGDPGFVYTEDVVINLISDSGSRGETFIGGEANCYILNPNGKAVEIPVSQANRGVDERIGANTELDWEFIWTDNPNGMSDAGAVSWVEVEGSGPTAKLIVYPGASAGNAVVAVKDKNNGKILWSWHLWVSDFDPNNDANDFYGFSVYEFLDRNLGALSEDPTDFRSQGLFYQWGRKDPFPYANEVGSGSFITIYDADGNTLNFPNDFKAASSGVMLNHSIENPLDFITVSYSSDWYSTDYSIGSSEVRRKMWHLGNTLEDIEKGAYDPCPDGWRVVPGDSGGNPVWYNIFSARIHQQGYSEVNGNVPSWGHADLGVWPHSGYINGGTVAFVSNNNQGYYWTANTNSEWSATGSLYVGFLPATTEIANDFDRRHALPIRCMRRTY